MLFDRWMEEGWPQLSFPPLAPQAVMWRRAVLFAEGGWRAMSGCEDTALVMSAAEKHPSIGVGAETIGVRQHPNRITRSQEHRASKRSTGSSSANRCSAQRRVRPVAMSA